MKPQIFLDSLKFRDKPLIDKLVATYGDDQALIETACERITKLVNRFIEKYPNSENIIIVRAPGRVNLIGEHTDYNGLPVMPMAISRDMLVAVAPSNDNRIHVANTDKGFGSNSFEIERHIPPYEHSWINYVKSATQGLIDYWSSAVGMLGANMVIDGNVPLASGLSSSAAFTVACAEALLAINHRKIPAHTFADLMAHSDHYVGTASGGMDQATSILGQAGKCLKIDFYPIRTETVELPKDCEIVVCHSRVQAAKAGNAKDEYNRRTVECRLAVALLHALGSKAQEPAPKLLSEWIEQENDGFAEALAFIENNLSQESYKVDAIANILGLAKEVVVRDYYLTKAEQPFPEPAEGFLIKQRARHVVAEAERVGKAFALLRAMPADAAVKFGELMNASHASCRDDYHISCPELEALVKAGRQAGSFASRLTGAGFGGCTVNLVPAGTSQKFMDAINKLYYTPHQIDTNEDNQFVFRPVQGSGVLFL